MLDTVQVAQVNRLTEFSLFLCPREPLERSAFDETKRVFLVLETYINENVRSSVSYAEEVDGELKNNKDIRRDTTTFGGNRSLNHVGSMVQMLSLDLAIRFFNILSSVLPAVLWRNEWFDRKTNKA